MRLVTGKAVETVDAGTFRARASEYRGLLLDVGTGDGALPYRLAGELPTVLCVGLDPNAAGMAEHARRASRMSPAGKPARGGRPNCAYVVASIEEPPEAMSGLADAITINFPWAALLEIVLGLREDSGATLTGALDRLAAPNCALQLLVNEVTDLPAIPAVDPALLRERLDSALAAAQFRISACEWLEPATRVRSRWGGRLIQGSDRRVVRLRASRGTTSETVAGLLDAVAPSASSQTSAGD